MAVEEVLNCDGTDPVRKIDWANVVGEKTLEDGGFFGDLLEVSRVHLDDAKNKGELQEKEVGAAYSAALLDAMKNAITFEISESKTQLELCLLQAQIDKLRAEIANETCLATAECALKKEQTESEAMQNMEDGVLEKQILKIQADIDKLICDCDNDTTLTDSKVSLNAAQENKLACDCCNSAKIATAQSRLYERQIEGFNDNANQKLYDTQMQAWSMVFADTEMDQVTPSIVDTQVCETYTRLRNRLSGTWDEDGNFIPGTGTACSGSSYSE